MATLKLRADIEKQLNDIDVKVHYNSVEFAMPFEQSEKVKANFDLQLPIVQGVQVIAEPFWRNKEAEINAILDVRNIRRLASGQRNERVECDDSVYIQRTLTGIRMIDLHPKLGLLEE